MSSLTVFDYVEGQQGEDLSTAVLDYLINQERESPHTQALLQTIGISSDEYTCSTQEQIVDGKADIYLESVVDDLCCIVENKFFAGFTYNVNNEHQLVRYCNWLNSQPFTTKQLVVLTLRRRGTEVQSIVDTLLSQFGDIQKSVVFWDDLIRKWKNISAENEKNTTVDQLSRFIDSHYVSSISLTKKETDVMTTRESATAYSKTMMIVDNVHSALDFVEKKNRKFELSDHSYGFEFSYKDRWYWFGLWPDAWEATGKPLWLQLSWVGKKEVSAMNASQIKIIENQGFQRIKTADGELLYGASYGFDGTEMASDDAVISKAKALVTNWH